MPDEKNPSPNQELPRPRTGSFEGTWGEDVMNNDMTQKLEEKLVARDLEANKDDYIPYERAIFIAEDTGAVFDGDGTDWKEADRQFESLRAGSVRTEYAGVDVVESSRRHGYDDGRIVADRFKSWSQEYPAYVAMLPYDSRTKGRVAFSWDDTSPEEYTDVFPLARDDGLPQTLYCNSRRIEEGGTRWGTDTSANDDVDAAVEMVTLGTEIANHGAEHRNLDDYDWEANGYGSREAYLRDEIWEGKRELEEMGFSVNSFLARAGSDINNGDHDTYKSNLIRSTHLISGDGFATQGLRNTSGWPIRYAGNRRSMDDRTEEEICELVDRAIRFGSTLELYGHASGWDWAGDGSTKLDNVFSYVQQKRRAGELDVATSLGSRLIPGDLDSVNVMPHPSFEAVSSFDETVWNGFGETPEIRSDGGSDGDGYLAFGQAVNDTGIGHGGVVKSFRSGPQIPTWTIEAKARTTSGGSAWLNFRNEYDNPDFGNDDHEITYEVDDTWTTYYATIGYTRREQRNRIAIWSQSDEVWLDELKMYPC